MEHAIAHIEEAVLHDQPEEQQRWYAIKIFERDAKVLEQLNIPADKMAHIERDIQAAEEELDDDAESIITNERYLYISGIMGGVQTRKATHKLNTSDRIDRVVTNRFLALPIFVVIMFLVYWVSMGPFGSMLTDWANDGVFGDGWHLLGIGTSAYEADSEPYTNASNLVNGYIEDQGLEDVAQALDSERENFDAAAAVTALEAMAAQVDTGYEFTYGVEDQETLAVTEETASGGDVIDAVTVLAAYDCQAPDPADYGIWVPGIPVLVQNGLTAIGCADWLSGLVLDGIIGGVGAVLGFVPQMLVLFLFLAFLETCGYMARIAFILDRIFRKFGLSGKSFIPMLVGTGCGVPGIMASRTIENERDRRMTIMTTTFIPCGAKLPIHRHDCRRHLRRAPPGSPQPPTSSGSPPLSCSGIILKKTRLFAGDPAPFVMELPAYHMPTVGNVLRSMWERGWSFIKKAGTIILLSTIVIWFLQLLRLCGRRLQHARGGPARPLHPGRHRQRHRLDLRSPGLGQLAGRRGLHHRSGGQGERCRHLGHPVRLRRGGRGRLNLATMGAAFTALSALFLPGFQPAVRPLLCGHGRHQAGDEQRQMDSGWPSATSAALPTWWACASTSWVCCSPATSAWAPLWPF